MKVVAIVSGGMDSAVLLHHLVKEREAEVLALSVNYGQRHVTELGYATAMCMDLGVRHKVADLTTITSLLGGSSQTDPSVEVPEGHYAAENMKLTVVPNRNMIMLSVAIGWAVSEKADFVAYAAHAGDHTIYPDCRTVFASAMDVAARLADWHEVGLMRPFIDVTKTDIAKIGKQLDVDFSKTWSCYRGGDVHCGRCGTCVERIQALNDAGVDDKTEYLDSQYALTQTQEG